MKSVIFQLTFIGLLLATAVMPGKLQAQAGDSARQKNAYDEIIIRQKGTPLQNVDIQVKGDEVWVNGKKLEEGSDSSIMVLRRKVPLRDGNTYAFGEPERNNFFFYSPEGGGPQSSTNKALLGVITEKADKGGARITDISQGTPAEKCGLRKGDIITKINEDKINDPRDLFETVGRYEPGDEITISYQRDGKSYTAKAELAKREDNPMDMLGITPGDNDNMMRRFRQYRMPPMNGNGFRFGMPRGDREPDAPKLGMAIQDTENGKGVKVLDVTSGSAAAEAGIRKGDVITQFRDTNVNTVEDVQQALQDNKDNDTVGLKIMRNNKTQTITIKVPRHLKTIDL